jgi:branched-chain amino acid aminotransferase
VIRVAKDNHIAPFTGDFTLAEVYTSEEAFLTGTLGGITPVTRVDGKTIGNGQPGPVTRILSDLYQAYITG